MSYRISDECIGCGSCKGECPAEAIDVGNDGKYKVDPEKCSYGEDDELHLDNNDLGVIEIL